jgi:hypothetical protein
MRRIALVTLLWAIFAGFSPSVAAAATEPAATVLITGSSRGIGLEFARQYAALGWRVIATCRNPDDARDLRQIAAVHPNLVIERMMVMHGVALDVAKRSIILGLVNPGLVDTRGIMRLQPGHAVPDGFVPVMPLVRSGVLKLITPTESVSAMTRPIDGLTPERSGKFLNYDGLPLPW